MCIKSKEKNMRWRRGQRKKSKLLSRDEHLNKLRKKVELGGGETQKDWHRKTNTDKVGQSDK